MFDCFMYFKSVDCFLCKYMYADFRFIFTYKLNGLSLCYCVTFDCIPILIKTYIALNYECIYILLKNQKQQFSL